MNPKQVKKGKKYVVSNGKDPLSSSFYLTCFKVLGISKKFLKVEWEQSGDISYIPFEDFKETDTEYASHKIIEEVNW